MIVGFAPAYLAALQTPSLMISKLFLKIKTSEKLSEWIVSSQPSAISFLPDPRPLKK